MYKKEKLTHMQLTDLESENITTEEPETKEIHDISRFNRFWWVANVVSIVMMLIIVSITCIVLIKVWKTKFKTRKSLICMAVLSIFLLVASFYTVYMGFACFEVEKCRSLGDLSLGYIHGCIWSFALITAFSILIGSLLGGKRDYFILIAIMFTIGLAIALYMFFMYIHPYSDLFDRDISILYVVHIIAAFIVCTTALSVRIANEGYHRIHLMSDAGSSCLNTVIEGLTEVCFLINAIAE